jgi:hypothetical protein
MDDAGGQSLEHGTHPFQKRRIPTDHDREGPDLDPGHVSRHRAIEEPRSGGVDGRTYRALGLGVDGAGVDGDRPGTDPGDDTRIAQVHRPDGLVVGETGDHDFGLGGRRCCGVGHAPPCLASDPVRLGAVAIPHDHVETGAPQGRRHGAAHPADAYNRYC